MNAEGGRRTVALVVDCITDYQLELIAGARAALDEAGVGLMVCVVHRRDDARAGLTRRQIAAGRFDGVILTTLAVGGVVQELLTTIAEVGIPLITVGWTSPGVPWVRGDSARAVGVLVRRLIEERRPQNVLFLRGLEGNEESDAREAAAAEVVAAHPAIAWTVATGSYEREDAYLAVREVLANRPMVDLVVAANDAMALGAMDALVDAGRAVPDQVRVAGVDDQPAARTAVPPLTTVSQRIPAQGRWAAEWIVAAVEGRAGDAAPEEVLEADLVWRESTGHVSDVEAAPRQRAAAEAELQHIVTMNRVFAACADLDELAAALVDHLPRLGVRRCFLALPDELVADPSGHLRLVLAYVDGAPIGPQALSPFSGEDLLPPELAGELERGTLTLQGLSLGRVAYGHLLYEQVNGQRITGEVLRNDISASISAIIRHRLTRQREQELRDLVAQRTRELEEVNAELQRLLLVDGLTGLTNRSGFDAACEREWRHHLDTRDPLGLLMVDVDHFKSFNDVHGHLEGDECLRAIGGALAECATRPRDVASRYGGEEFALLLPETGREGCEQVAERVHQRMAELARPHRGTGGVVTVSVGIAVATGELEDVESLVDIADQALYAA